MKKIIFIIILYILIGCASFKIEENSSIYYTIYRAPKYCSYVENITENNIRDRYKNKIIISNKNIIDSINHFKNSWKVDTLNRVYNKKIFLFLELNNSRISISLGDSIQYNNCRPFKDSIFINFLDNHFSELNIKEKFIVQDSIQRNAQEIGLNIIMIADKSGLLPIKYNDANQWGILYQYIYTKIAKNESLSIEYNEDIKKIGNWLILYQKNILNNEITKENADKYNYPSL